jgi:hypothetical protein
MLHSLVHGLLLFLAIYLAFRFVRSFVREILGIKPRQVSRLSEEERLAWVERDRFAGIEKERQVKARSLSLPGGRFDRFDPD